MSPAKKNKVVPDLHHLPVEPPFCSNRFYIMPQCSLCKREVAYITYHHLVPKEEGGKGSKTVPLCQPCHNTIHKTFTNKELAMHYNSISTLESSPYLHKYLQWIKKQKTEFLKNK